MSDTIAQAILLCEQRRCAAMRDNDLPTLDTLLHAELHFSHATGAIDDKAAYMAKMAQARIVYRSIEWAEQHVAVLGSGDVALLSGQMTSNVMVNGVDKRLDNRVLAVWVRSSADGSWRLRAFQPTPLSK